MDSMLAAIKAKRGGGKMMEEEVVETNGGGDLKSLVDGLDHKQCEELLSLLAEKVQGSNQSEEILKGEPSPKEKSVISAKADEEQELERMSEDDSDDIARSMIDRNSEKLVEAGATPRNLGERARMSMVERLKGKGKQV